MDTEDLLSEEVLDGIPERAWLDGPAELIIGNQRLEEVSLSAATTVYEIGDEHLGLVVEGAGLRLLASVDRDALRPVLVSPTVAVPDPSRASDGIGLRFPAGTPVDVEAAIGDSVLMEASVSWLEGSGWVPLTAVGDYAIRDEDHRGWIASMLLAADTPLLDAPDGEAFAWLTEPMPAISVGAAEGQWQRIEITRAELSVQAYVPVDKPLRDLIYGGWGFGWSGGCGSFILTDEDPILPAGMVLRDAPGGAAVGVVLRELSAPILDREEGLDLVGVETPWGVVELWTSDG